MLLKHINFLPDTEYKSKRDAHGNPINGESIDVPSEAIGKTVKGVFKESKRSESIIVTFEDGTFAMFKADGELDEFGTGPYIDDAGKIEKDRDLIFHERSAMVEAGICTNEEYTAAMQEFEAETKRNREERKRQEMESQIAENPELAREILAKVQPPTTA